MNTQMRQEEEEEEETETERDRHRDRDAEGERETETEAEREREPSFEANRVFKRPSTTHPSVSKQSVGARYFSVRDKTKNASLPDGM